MRRAHFDALRPVCPLCRATRQVDSPLAVGLSLRESPEGDLREGALHCTNPACFMEYPVLDGAPILSPAVRSYVQDNLYQLMARDDLSAEVESMLGDASGPGSALDATRQYVSSYAWDHWGDLDPAEVEAPGGPAPGSMLRCLEAVLAQVPAIEAGAPVLDLGCSVGRSTFELAAKFTGPVVGIDLGFSMLRVGRRVLESGVVRYPRRRVGVVYDRRAFPVEPAGRERVDLWVADALQLPFAEATFGLVVGLNVLDCVSAPRDLLASVARVLRPGGSAVLATPYDWSAGATPIEAWLGGHSQRGPGGGAPEPMLRSLLTPGGHPMAIPGLRIVAEAESLPWQVRLHDRSTVSYRVHAVVLRRDATSIDTECLNL